MFPETIEKLPYKPFLPYRAIVEPTIYRLQYDHGDCASYVIYQSDLN